MKKRLISLIMLLALGSTMVGCGESDSNNKSSQSDKKTTESVESSSEDKAKDETENDKKDTTESKEKENTTDTTDTTEDNGTDTTDDVVESKKQIYLDKLNETEETLSAELKPLYDSGVTLDMREAAGKEYETWDGLLNEIWAVLTEQLSEEEINELTDLENKWIEDTEAKAKEESLKYEGGTMEPLVYSQTLASETKNRCYELVNEYMK